MEVLCFSPQAGLLFIAPSVYCESCIDKCEFLGGSVLTHIWIKNIWIRLHGTQSHTHTHNPELSYRWVYLCLWHEQIKKITESLQQFGIFGLWGIMDRGGCSLWAQTSVLLCFCRELIFTSLDLLSLSGGSTHHSFVFEFVCKTALTLKIISNIAFKLSKKMFITIQKQNHHCKYLWITINYSLNILVKCLKSVKMTSMKSYLVILVILS